MNKRNLIFLSAASLIFLSMFLYYGQKAEREAPSVNESVYAQEKIRIVACPTCYEMAKELDAGKYRIIPTASTAESIELIKSGQADLMLAGRILKPDEPRMEEIIIDNGYSFIGNQEISIAVDELKNYAVYTDLDIDLIKNYFPVEEIHKVDNVYHCLDKGIAVTSWENTDYAKAKIVHLIGTDGRRMKLSRQPAIYCPLDCGAEAEELALLLK